MAQIKKKSEPEKPKRGLQKNGSQKKVASRQMDPGRYDDQAWKAEIQKLSGHEYKSIRAAIEAVVDMVLIHYPPPLDKLEQTRSFLLDLLESDPTIEEILLSNLTIVDHVK